MQYGAWAKGNETGTWRLGNCKMMIKVLVVVCANRRRRQTEQFPKSNRTSVSSISRFIAIIYSANESCQGFRVLWCTVHCKLWHKEFSTEKLYLGLLVGTGVLNIMQTDDPHTYECTNSVNKMTGLTGGSKLCNAKYSWNFNDFVSS